MSQPTSRAQSRTPSRNRGDSPSQQRQPSRGRRSLSRRSPSIVSTISDSGAEEAPQSKRNRRRHGNRRRGGDMPAVEEVEDTGRQVAGTAGNAASAVGDTGAVTKSSDDDEKGSDKPLKLRLDLNLDADIRLTAKVHGDITLSLL